MKKKTDHQEAGNSFHDCPNPVEWLAQGGITVDSVEIETADDCPVCRAIDLDVAA